MNSVFPLSSAFLALPLEGEAHAHYVQLQEVLQPFADCLRFQPQESPHVTLYFWKELLEIEYHDVCGKSAAIAARTAPLTVQVCGVDTFGKTGKERVLFLAIAFSPELASLKKLCPWPNPPDQSFHPHITIARISHPQKFAVHRKKILKLMSDADFPVPMKRVCLYATVNGRAQTQLHEWVLQGLITPP